MQVNKQKTETKYNIICLSNQLWDFTNWTNKHHVMSRLADRGHKVLFVDPPINTGRVFLKQLQRGFWPPKRILTQLKYINENLTVYTPLNIVPFQSFTSFLHSKRIESISKKYFGFRRKENLGRQTEEVHKNQPTILWVYHVEINGIDNYLNNVSHNLAVYDCVDNYEGFPQYDTLEKKDRIRKQEEFLAKNVDLIFASAPGLVDKLKSFNENVFFTPNVGDYDKFKDVKNLRGSLPEEMRVIPRPRIGFTGSLDEYKFDLELFKKTALENPNYSFVLIGQIALKDREASLREIGMEDVKNVYFLGARRYGEIQNYFAGFDAFIIPYQLNDYTVGGCFPVKFHDALAAGLPVVVTDLPAYAPFKDVCYISKTYADFSGNLKLALEEDSDKKVSQRQKVAKQNNWDGKVETMLNLIGQYIKS